MFKYFYLLYIRVKKRFLFCDITKGVLQNTLGALCSPGY